MPVLIAVTALLSGCGLLNDLERREYSLDPRRQFTTVPASRGWIVLPESSLLTQRQVGGTFEQRGLLPNRTALAGDNVVFMRAVPNDPSGTPGRISLDRMLDAIDGVPFPFTEDDLDLMRSRTDAGGALIWTVFTDGAGTYCALAFRRLDSARRVVFLGAEAIHLVMRNCVNGTEEDALHPLRPEVIGFPTIGSVRQPGAPRTLSPLAAPLP